MVHKLLTEARGQNKEAKSCDIRYGAKDNVNREWNKICFKLQLHSYVELRSFAAVSVWLIARHLSVVYGYFSSISLSLAHRRSGIVIIMGAKESTTWVLFIWTHLCGFCARKPAKRHGRRD